MAIGNDVSLYFKIKGESSDGVRAFKDIQREADATTKSTIGLTSAFSGMVNPVALATAGLTAIAAAAVAGTV